MARKGIIQEFVNVASPKMEILKNVIFFRGDEMNCGKQMSGYKGKEDTEFELERYDTRVRGLWFLRK